MTNTDRAEQLERDIKSYQAELRRSIEQTQAILTDGLRQDDKSAEAARAILETLKGAQESAVHAMDNMLDGTFKQWDDYHKGSGPKPGV
jgi:hypothetical protein